MLRILVFILCVATSSVTQAQPRHYVTTDDGLYTLILAATELKLTKFGKIEVLIVSPPWTEVPTEYVGDVGGLVFTADYRATTLSIPLVPKVKQIGSNRFEITGVQLPAPGTWDFRYSFHIGTHFQEMTHPFYIAPDGAVSISLK